MLFFLKYRRTLLVITLSLVALFFRLRAIYRKPFLDGDELWQVSLMKGNSFGGMILGLPGHEHCSFLSGDYLLIYPFFRIFGENKWGVAIPHILVTVIGFYFLYLLAKRYLTSLWGFLITFGIVAFNAWLIEHSMEIRTYAVLPTLAMMSLYFSEILAERYDQLALPKKMWLGLFFVAVLWFHVYGVVIVLTTVLYPLLFRRDQTHFKILLKKFIKYFVIVFLIAMPLWCISVLGPHLPHTLSAFQGRNINTFDYIANPLVNPLRFLKQICATLIGFKKFYFLLLGIIFPFFFPLPQRYKQIGFLLTLVVLPLLLLLHGVLKDGYWFVQRQYTWVMPFFALYLAWSWESIIFYGYDKVIKKIRLLKKFSQKFFYKYKSLV